MWGSELERLIGKNETILWRGKPDKKCFILESIFNPMLPFALIWGAFDLFFVGVSMMSSKEMFIFILLFMSIHMMPVWMYLGGIICSFIRYKNTEYIVTDRGIYVSGGAFTFNYEMKPFTDLSHINVHRGIFDQMLGVGDVISECGHASYNGRNSHSHSSHGISICDIRDYAEVYNMIKELQTDIYSDTMYPNDLRPAENHGYKTAYRPDGDWDGR